MENTAEKESLVTFRTNQGLEVQAKIGRLTRHLAVFEVFNTTCVLQMSEVLNEFKIMLNERLVYSNRAVITGLLNTGTVLIIEATLEDAWLDGNSFSLELGTSKLREDFQKFLTASQKSFRVLPEFKMLVADMHNFLYDLRLWLEQVELGIRSTPSGDRVQLERQVLGELLGPIVPTLNALFEKFEYVAAKIEPGDKPAHRAFIRNQLHPLLMCSPFAYRTYHKPLGYAGDYEMVNMILRDPFEGGSLFAKLLHAWFVTQPPAEAHRNRVKYLHERLVQETGRMAAQGKVCRVFNLACGPAGEVQKFLKEDDLSSRADITLLDFNDETLAYTGRVLNEIRSKHHRNTRINMVKKSVVQVLKGRGKSTVGGTEKYDFVYCAGLFDYLSDQYCKQLMNIFYDMLAPGGLLVATNVDAFNPIQQMLDYILDWILIYRSGEQLEAVAPDAADPDYVKVLADVTSVNIHLEVRKPMHE